METDVTHNGANDHILSQTALFLQMTSAQEHNLVAIKVIAVFIGKEATVSVTIVSNTGVSAVFLNCFAKAFHVGGASVFVDINAVRIYINRNHVNT